MCLNLEDIVKIKNAPAYIVIAEPFSRADRLICLTNPSFQLRLGQVIDVEGDLTTLPGGARALENVTVWGYASKTGELTYHPLIIKWLPLLVEWPGSRIDLTVGMSTSASAASTAAVSSNEPNSDPAAGPRFYPQIGDNVDSVRVQSQGVRIQSYYPEIPGLQSLAIGSVVELQCKRITAVGAEPINGTVYKYFDMAEDLPSTDWIRCYYTTGAPTTGNRINKITGQIQITSTRVICIDDGPGYNPQTLVGALNLVSPDTVAFAGTQANGATATLTGKVVTANQTDFPGALYVQEPSASGCFGGIRVLYSGSAVGRGNLVDITGTIALASDGEREIDAGSNGVTFVQQSSVPGPLGMPNKRLGGGSFNVLTPGVNYPTGSGTGLYNKGLLVKSWGKVTTVDAANKFFYIDDGTGFQDGSGNTGVKVSWAWSSAGKPAILPPAVNWYVSVTGLSSSDTADSGATYYRVIRLRGQSDITLFSPQDSTNPEVTITMPSSNGQIHLATGQTTTQLAGTAVDAATGVISVQVGFTATGSQTPPTTWYSASYNSTTHIWTYDWQTPQMQKMWLKATDFAGNTATTSRDVTVSTVTVIYVNGGTGNNSNNGLSWSLAKKTISGTTGALYTAVSGNEIWVKKGTYVERVSMKSGVGLYGGFAGTENMREARDWKTNTTSIIGTSSVVTMSNVSGCVVDGFTIRGGSTGITCSSATTTTIANNIIRDNLLGNGGGGLSASNSNLTVCGNVICFNKAFSGGGIYYSGTNGQIVNNTIICNTGTYNPGNGGISFWYCSPDIINNIVAFNTGGVYNAYGAPTLINNNVYGNDQNGSYNYSGFSSIPSTEVQSDPQLPNISSGDWHIAVTSPCINA